MKDHWMVFKVCCKRVYIYIYSIRSKISKVVLIDVYLQNPFTDPLVDFQPRDNSSFPLTYTLRESWEELPCVVTRWKPFHRLGSIVKLVFMKLYTVVVYSHRNCIGVLGCLVWFTLIVEVLYVCPVQVKRIQQRILQKNVE